MKILFLCTGNSARSQMAEGFMKSFATEFNVYSAGTNPAGAVNPYAVRAMAESGIDISSSKTKKADIFLNDAFDYVITVCDDARETCPYFSGDVGHRLHISFKDPAKVTGSDEEVMREFRDVRDQIGEACKLLLIQIINNRESRL